MYDGSVGDEATLGLAQNLTFLFVFGTGTSQKEDAKPQSEQK